MITTYIAVISIILSLLYVTAYVLGDVFFDAIGIKFFTIYYSLEIMFFAYFRILKRHV